MTNVSIKTQAIYVRTRENVSQLGYRSKVGEVVRLAFCRFVAPIRMPYLHNHAFSLFSQILKFDSVSPRRTKTLLLGMASDEGKALLLGFAFRKNDLLIS
jgi:hypothetical protein